MRVHQTEELFGLDVFSGPLEAESPAAEESGETTSIPRKKRKIPAVDVFQLAGPLKRGLGELWCKKLLLGMVFTVIAATVGISLFTLVMKTKRKAVSYELSYQTRLFRRMSKHRAIYELEYAYQKENHPLVHNQVQEGWRKITPHDLTYIPMNRRDLPRKRDMSWQQ